MSSLLVESSIHNQKFPWISYKPDSIRFYIDNFQKLQDGCKEPKDLRVPPHLMGNDPDNSGVSTEMSYLLYLLEGLTKVSEPICPLLLPPDYNSTSSEDLSCTQSEFLGE